MQTRLYWLSGGLANGRWSKSKYRKKNGWQREVAVGWLSERERRNVPRNSQAHVMEHLTRARKFLSFDWGYVYSPIRTTYGLGV